MQNKQQIPIKIRKINDRDLSDIREICKTSFPLDDAFEIASSLFEIEHFYVAEESTTQKVLGFIAFGIHSLKSVHIIILAIHKKYQRKNIGTELLEYCFKVVKQTPVSKIRLEVRTTNKQAINFYERFDFKIKATIKDYYDDNADAYLMLKEL